MHYDEFEMTLNYTSATNIDNRIPLAHGTSHFCNEVKLGLYWAEKG